MEGPVMKLRVESALTVRLIEFYGTFDGYEDKKSVMAGKTRGQKGLITYCNKVFLDPEIFDHWML